VVSDQIVEEETVLRFADELDVSIPAEGVDAELANRLEIEADAPGFADVYQAELDRIGLIDEEYRQIVEARLLADKIRVKLSADIPPDAEQVRYSLIQVETESEAQQVLARLQAGEDFAALAGEVSIDARSKDQGGDSGWLAKGSVDRAVEEVLFSLETGAISDSFPTPNGVFVFQVQEKEIRPLDDSQRRQVETQTYQRWLEDQQQGLEIKNYVAIDSDKLDQNKLRWALDHGQPVTTQPTVPQPLVPSP
jgi:parvulin-like peptidyl-prolyl isomerase